MSYQVKRIDPFWHNHPMIPTAIVIGGILAMIGFQKQATALALVGAAVAGVAVVVAARPVVSAVLATLGVFGGLVTFVFVPNQQSAGMSLGMRLLSTVLFALFYMILMDALVLVVSVLYNLFGGALGLGGIKLELESQAEEEADEAGS